MKRILFVSHEASRTGAPIALLTFIRWFRENSSHQFEILLKEGGELEAEFKALGPTTVLGADRHSGLTLLERAMANRMGMRELARKKRDMRMRRRLARFRDVDLIYINGVTCSSLLKFFDLSRAKVIAHIHELNFPFKYVLRDADKEALFAKTDLFVACSAAVKHVLTERQGAPESKVVICHEFIADSNPSRSTSAERQAVKKSLGFPKDALIVGGAGAAEWRKGVDLFAHLAATLPPDIAGRPVRLLWVGGETNSQFFKGLMHEIEQSRVEDRLHITGYKEDPMPFFNVFDVFVITSREDPFPLVCLEAAALGKPTVCFDSGGIQEFVSEDAGVVVAYPRVDSMAAAVTELLLSPDRRKELGKTARAKIKSAHGIEHAGPRLNAYIEEVLR